MVVHHRLVSSSNLELEEERDTSNGERRRRKQWLIDRTARTVAVLCSGSAIPATPVPHSFHAVRGAQSLQHEDIGVCVDL